MRPIKVGEEREIAGVKCIAIPLDDFNGCEPSGCPAHRSLHDGDSKLCNSTWCAGIFWVPIKDEPWTPKNGEVVEVSDREHPDYKIERIFVAMDGEIFVCRPTGANNKRYRGWDSATRIRQPEPTPTQDPQLTEALAENTRLKEELNTLKNSLKDLIDRVEKVK